MDTNVYFILDKSGSMLSCREAAISGFNEYIGNLKKDKKSKYKLSLTLFDTKFEKIHDGVSLKNVKDLDKDSYFPDGMTALYDAVCSTLKGCEAKNGKNLVVIFTDGEENSSQEYSELQFSKLVKDLEAKKNWTFVYLGANQDAWGKASKWGFAANNVSNYNATAGGVANAMRNLSNATMTYSCSASMNTRNFMSDDQKTSIENAK